MTIYADILVLVNLYVDFFLLWCVKSFLHMKSGGLRLLAGALAGAFSTLAVLFPLPRPALFLWGLVSAFLCTAAAFLPVSLLLYIKSSLCFWIFSFLLAGFLLFLSSLLGPGSVTALGNAVYFNLSPVFLFFSTAAAYLLFRLLHKLFPQRPVLRCCKITVTNRGKSATLFCKVDTGCNLREPFSGLPVIVAESDFLRDVAPPEALLYPSTSLEAGGLRLVPFTSVGGEGLLPAFRPEQAVLLKTGTVLSCYLALSAKKLGAGEYNGLINPDLFPDSISFPL